MQDFLRTNFVELRVQKNTIEIDEPPIERRQFIYFASIYEKKNSNLTSSNGLSNSYLKLFLSSKTNVGTCQGIP